MSDETLGLAVGTTNLTAVRPGREPVSRRAVLTLWEGKPAEVGVPAQNPELTSPNPTAPGVVLRGFVERVGDPVPLIAPDGSAHRGEVLTATALESMARAVDGGRPATSVVVAVPAHWGPVTIGALRGALRGSPLLAPGGVAPLIVSDATAALAAVQAEAGLPDHGVVALCDFGAGGSSITLCDAAAGFATIGETVRFADFGGDQLDQALLTHIVSGASSAAPADQAATAGTAAVGSLMRLREQCQLAKERLSTDASAVVGVDLPDYHADVQITRAELESLADEPFAGFLDALGDALEQNRIPAATLSAVATVGGGAALPFITQRLSSQLRVPVITPAAPGLTAARGAAVLAATGTTQAVRTTVITEDAPTSLAPTAWAAGAAGAAATESASDGSPSATFRALAWSQDDPDIEDPVPYAGGDYTGPDYSGPEYSDSPTAYERPPSAFDSREAPTTVVDGPLPWYRRPSLLFGIAAALAALAVGGLAITLTTDSTPTTTTTRVTKPGEVPGSEGSNPPPTPETVTVTGDNGQPTVSTVTPTTTSPPETTSTTPTTTTTTTTTTPTTTTTTTTTTPTTTTTTPTTTTRTTTTTAPTTTQPPTTTQQPTTTVAPPTTTVAPPTTTAAPAPITVEPVVTTVAPVPTVKPAPAE